MYSTKLKLHRCALVNDYSLFQLNVVHCKPQPELKKTFMNRAPLQD
jgi:hypothetical protein